MKSPLMIISTSFYLTSSINPSYGTLLALTQKVDIIHSIKSLFTTPIQSSFFIFSLSDLHFLRLTDRIDLFQSDFENTDT